MALRFRFVPRVSTKVGPFNVGVSAYPTRDPRAAYMAHDPRRTERPRASYDRPASAPNQTVRTAQDYRAALQAHERAMASIRRQAGQDGVFFTPAPSVPRNVPAAAPVQPAWLYTQPTTYRSQRPAKRTQRPTQRSTHKPFGFYLAVMVATVVGGFITMGVLGMLLTAAHVLPATGASDTSTPRPAVSHSAPANVLHTVKGGAAHK